jgi:UTP-glucose-1-phosphate uridylyltransferase
MSDRLDRIEAGLDETRKIVESNSKAIEAWANESIEFRNEMRATTKQLEATAERFVTSIELLTQVVVRLDARQ